MSIKKKFAFVIFITFAIAIGLLYFSMNLIVYNKLHSVENSLVTRNTNRLKYAISNELSTQLSKQRDWANWDDLYEFTVNKNKEFIDSNLLAKSYEDLKISCFAVIDNKNNIVHYDKYDSLNDKMLTATAADRAQLLQIVREAKKSELEGSFVEMNGNLKAVTALPIRKSDGSGQAIGTLVWAQDIDNTFTGRMSKLMQIEAHIYPISALSSEDRKNFDRSKKDGKIFFQELENRKLIGGYIPLTDFNGSVNALARIDYPKELNGEVNVIMGWFYLLTPLSALLAGMLCFYYVRKHILSRIIELNTFLQVADKEKNKNARIHFSGNDEVAELGESFNKLMDDLEKSEIKSN